MAGVPIALLGVPRELAPSSLPGHRVLTATLLNGGGAPLAIHAADLTLHGEDGAKIRAAVQLDALGSKEARLEPGYILGFTAAWHGAPFAELRYEGAPLIARTRQTA